MAYGSGSSSCSGYASRVRVSSVAFVMAIAACAGSRAEPPSREVAPSLASATPAPSSPPSASASASASAAPAIPHLKVHLVPLGEVADATIAETVRGLSARAPITAIVEPRRALPDEAKTIEKNRYSADALLRFLEKVPAGAREKVMGVADVDIVTPKNGVPRWGILGLGSIDGRVSVISTYRMRRAWEKPVVPESLVRERLAKIALHELGHTLGLDHCPNKGCIMEDAHGTVKTVDSEDVLCPTCAARVAAAIAAAQ